MRNAQRGDTFFNCLVVMVLVMGTVMWAWVKFGAHYPIKQGGKAESVVVDGSGNRQATLRYQERMRERFFLSSQHVIAQASELVAKTGQGTFASDRAAFEQRCSEVVRGLEDNFSELNANKVPATFAEGHLKLGLAHRHAYEAVQLLGLALAAEPEMRKRHFREAADLAAKAGREVRVGRQMLEPRFQ